MGFIMALIGALLFSFIITLGYGLILILPFAALGLSLLLIIFRFFNIFNETSNPKQDVLQFEQSKEIGQIAKAS